MQQKVLTKEQPCDRTGFTRSGGGKGWSSAQTQLGKAFLPPAPELLMAVNYGLLGLFLSSRAKRLAPERGAAKCHLLSEQRRQANCLSGVMAPQQKLLGMTGF